MAPTITLRRYAHARRWIFQLSPNFNPVTVTLIYTEQKPGRKKLHPTRSHSLKMTDLESPAYLLRVNALNALRKAKVLQLNITTWLQEFAHNSVRL